MVRSSVILVLQASAGMAVAPIDLARELTQRVLLGPLCIRESRLVAAPAIAGSAATGCHSTPAFVAIPSESHQVGTPAFSPPCWLGARARGDGGSRCTVAASLRLAPAGQSLWLRTLTTQASRPPEASSSGSAQAAQPVSPESARQLGVGRQQGEQARPQQQQQGDWEDDEELAPVPLDPNAKPPGLVFVAVAATLSALLAVGVAAFGICGTFYVGYAISQVAKELRSGDSASRRLTGSSGRTVAASGGAAAGPGDSVGAAGRALQGAAAIGTSQAAGSSPPAAAAYSSGSTVGLEGALEAPQAAAGQLGPAGAAGGQPAAASRRGWWAWLGLGFRKEKQPQQEVTPAA